MASDTATPASPSAPLSEPRSAPPSAPSSAPASTGGPTGPVRPGKRGFRAGLVASVSVWLAVAPFGMIFGVLATEAGLDLFQTMAYTIIVIAGASQLAALQVLEDGAPALLAVFTGAVVNLRMAMYSASIAAQWQGVGMTWRVPAAWFLHDQAFALSMRRYGDRPDESLSDRLGFYFGVGLSTSGIWIVATLLGATLGGQIPASWGLDFAVPATFVAVAAPMIRGTANIAAAASAAVAAILLAWLPAGFGLLAAAILGIAVGLAVEARMGAGTRRAISDGDGDGDGSPRGGTDAGDAG